MQAPLKARRFFLLGDQDLIEIFIMEKKILKLSIDEFRFEFIPDKTLLDKYKTNQIIRHEIASKTYILILKSNTLITQVQNMLTNFGITCQMKRPQMRFEEDSKQLCSPTDIIRSGFKVHLSEFESSHLFYEKNFLILLENQIWQQFFSEQANYEGLVDYIEKDIEYFYQVIIGKISLISERINCASAQLESAEIILDNYLQSQNSQRI